MLNPAVLALTMEGALSQHCRHRLEAGKGKETIFPDSLEETWLSDILILAPSDPLQAFDIQNCKIIYLVLF